MIYAKIDESGYIVSYTDSPTDGLIAIDHPYFLATPNIRLKLVDGKIIEEPIYNWAVERVKSYPSIGDQLDALWKGGDALAEMQARIMAVKEKYPKPS